MTVNAAPSQNPVYTRDGAPISRRVVLAAGAGLVGTAAVAPSSAAAQTAAPTQAPAAAPMMPAVQAPVRQEWLAKHTEEILEPELPIIDPHHHLWDQPGYRYMVPELLADLSSGHKIVATMFEPGPRDVPHRRTGGTKFARRDRVRQRRRGNGRGGQIRHDEVHRRDRRICRSAPRLARQGGPRAAHRGLRRPGGGIRNGTTWSDNPTITPFGGGMPQGLLLDMTFREGFAALAPLGLAFDAWMFQTQLGDLVDLARAFPQTTIVLNHVGGPIAIGPYAGKRDEAFKEWRGLIQQIAGFPNSYVKLGGLGMKMIGFDFFNNPEPPSLQDLEKAWRPYIETCIAAFGPERSMFESNFPVDKGTCSYQVLWNAFKRLAAGHSADEKAALFSGAARKAYRLQV